ncbi:MAG: 16S rRNA (guanine(527)-N(7))-methyltransferase RsmG [Ignavibacteria bacterium]|nr:16S rRNA (guanine(527)-N(7))-methyltransferase RsmG [Ignavibacteria bacterium]MBT8391182.1 16S rRNA (guanine(527)-N(7))-methyltransferase RsmG [Ignavibacteria bacterium]NNJ52786.1 16S rRNA (guanine(527)-N(7))-methyltransferase RsmG [Ignavibacteriaceae bacterium]NNL22151.1 16S rRNA (guanine(527)-N(7))-methyltransferase RsmG [Ignavibacteriaceae bacterium]
MADKQEQYLKELKVFCWENGFNPEPTRTERLAFFAQLVADKNKKLNLISKRDIDSIVEKHVFISAYITKYLPEKVTKFLDIGTGGGFPGIPLGIMRPDLRGILVDSTSKKVDAVKKFIDDLKLSNIIAENQRVESEEFINRYKGSFDLIVSRATVPLIILFRYAVPLIKEKAYLMAIKGGDLTDEFKKAEMKYKSYIKKSTVYELHYKPTNIRNKKGKKLVLIELQR